MVFPNLSSDNEIQINGLKSKTFPIPSVLDRLLAFILDLLILTPTVGIFLFWIIKDIRNFTFLERDLFEIQVLWALYVLAFAFIAILLLGIFIYKFKGSPGQIFMKLKVVNYPNINQELTFDQSMARSFFYILNFIFLGFPFLEVFTNARRRIMHERISETMVVSLTHGPDDFPLHNEKKFFSLFSKYLLVSALFVFLFGFYLVYTTVTTGGFREKDPLAQKDSCSMNSKIEGYSSLDVILVYYLMGSESRDCLEHHIDQILWQKSGLKSEENSSQILFAYLAAALSEEDVNYQEKYFNLICKQKEKDPELCSIVEQFQKEKDLILDNTKMKYLVSDYFKLKTLLLQNEKTKANHEIQQFYKKGITSNYLSSNQLKIIWSLNKEVYEGKVDSTLQEPGLRQPSSLEGLSRIKANPSLVSLEEKKKIVSDYIKEKGLE